MRRILLLAICWVSANVVLYFGLEQYEESMSRSKGYPSSRTLRLFAVVPSESDAKSELLQSSLKSRLMSPPSGKADVRYPLLIFLHGSGQRGDDNERQLLGLPEQLAEAKWHRRFPCYVLAPQCPEGDSWTKLDRELLDLIQRLVKRYPIEMSRIYLTGLSMGGYGSWKLAAREPDLFAAVVPICGGGQLRTAERLIDVPIWAVHGDEDQSVRVEESQQMVNAIRAAGGKKIKYAELKGVGHDSWTQTYQDPEGVLNWMFQQTNERQSTSTRD